MHTIHAFHIDGKYYRFVRFPFGIWLAPFTFQMLMNAFARHLRAHDHWGWGHADNVLLAHPDPQFLLRQYNNFFDHLDASDFRLNPADSTFTPSLTIDFFGYHSTNSPLTIGHLPSQVALIHDLLHALNSAIPLSHLFRAPGLLPFYLSLYQTGLYVLRPFFNVIHYHTRFFPRSGSA